MSSDGGSGPNGIVIQAFIIICCLILFMLLSSCTFEPDKECELYKVRVEAVDHGSYYTFKILPTSECAKYKTEVK